MRPRDPREPGRTATPLELYFDLVFVVAFTVTVPITIFMLGIWWIAMRDDAGTPPETRPLAR